MVESRFVAPEREKTRAVVVAALRAAGERAQPSSWQWIEYGSANVVVLAGAAAVRVSRSARAVDGTLRAQRVIDALPSLPFDLPRSLAEPVREGDVVAVVQRRLRGAPHPSGRGDPGALAVLLDGLAAVPVGGIPVPLAEPHSFMGGSGWHELLTAAAIPLLDPASRVGARRAVDALAALPPVPSTLVHGDLAGSNVLWSAGSVSAVVDWDLACAGDPAVDLAAVGAWHGWEVVDRVRPAAEVGRARVIAATHAVQVVGFAIVNDRPADELRRAVDRASARYA